MLNKNNKSFSSSTFANESQLKAKQSAFNIIFRIKMNLNKIIASPYFFFKRESKPWDFCLKNIRINNKY